MLYSSDLLHISMSFVSSKNENSFYSTTVYLGHPSLKFQKHVKSVFHKFKVEIKPAYNSRKVSNYFNNKSNRSDAFDANFVYKYTCSEDQNIYYLGETSRQLF